MTHGRNIRIRNEVQRVLHPRHPHLERPVTRSKRVDLDRPDEELVPFHGEVGQRHLLELLTTTNDGRRHQGRQKRDTTMTIPSPVQQDDLQAIHAQMVMTVDLMIEGTHFFGSRELAERVYGKGSPMALFAEVFARYEIQRYDWITALDGTIISRRELA